MANPPGAFIWYELLTTDANAAAKFYGEVVGWKIPERADPGAPPGRDYRMIGRDDGGSCGGVFQLTPDMTQHGAQPSWLAYFHVKDVDVAMRSIEAEGGRTLMPKMTLPVGQIAMMADPMGTPFYVMDPVPPPGKPDAASDVFHPAKAQHVRWNELQSPDLARAKAFYAKLFGFVFNEVMPMGPMGDYCFIDQGGLRVGAMMQRPPQSPHPAAWLFYFGVDSVAAAKRAIEKGGGKILNGPHQVPGGEWIVTATDPQGAPFGVVGSKGE